MITSLSIQIYENWYQFNALTSFDIVTDLEKLIKADEKDLYLYQINIMIFSWPDTRGQERYPWQKWRIHQMQIPEIIKNMLHFRCTSHRWQRPSKFHLWKDASSSREHVADTSPLKSSNNSC